jgi:hypothetical protein
MKSSVRLLLCWLFAATVGASAFAGPNRDMLAGSRARDQVEQESLLMLAGSNGHDSVGGLMPLSLWPSRGFHAQGTVPARSWKHSTVRHPNKAHIKLTLADRLI